MTETHKAITLVLVLFSLAAIRILTRRVELRSLGSGYLDATAEWRRWTDDLAPENDPLAKRPWKVRVREALKRWTDALRMGERRSA